MTRDEAERLARVFETVDNGCTHCIFNVCEQANRAMLGFYFEQGAVDDHTVNVLDKPPTPGFKR